MDTLVMTMPPLAAKSHCRLQDPSNEGAVLEQLAEAHLISRLQGVFHCIRKICRLIVAAHVVVYIRAQHLLWQTLL